MNMLKNYQILGVNMDCSDEELKTSYRKLAKQWHPDINKNPEASNKFKEIQKAYDSILLFRKHKNEFDPFMVVNNVFNNSFWTSYFNNIALNTKTKIELEFDELSETDSNKLFEVLKQAGFNVRRSSIIRSSF